MTLLRRSGGSLAAHRLRFFGVLLAALLAVFAPAIAATAASYPNPETISGSTYAHDPSMVKTTSGRYYLFYTGGGIQISTSTDRVHWSSAGQVLPGGASWAKSYGGWNDLWAPDVSYHNGVYWLYYAVSSFGHNHSAIGLATSTTAAPGSWTDHEPEHSYTSANPGTGLPSLTRNCPQDSMKPPRAAPAVDATARPPTPSTGLRTRTACPHPAPHQLTGEKGIPCRTSSTAQHAAPA
jgi:hypothetical protein